MNNPYLSIVLCGRNDNYGGDFIARFQRFIDWNIKYLETYKIHTEIIFVNWNPVAENFPIEQLISIPHKRKYVKFKIITVPTEIHQEYENPTLRLTVPIFEFIAKNVGIRRAKGKFLLTTNADILISESIIKQISKRKLNEKMYYRANRFDFKKTETLTLKKINENINLLNLKGYS